MKKVKKKKRGLKKGEGLRTDRPVDWVIGRHKLTACVMANGKNLRPVCSAVAPSQYSFLVPFASSVYTSFGYKTQNNHKY